MNSFKFTLDELNELNECLNLNDSLYCALRVFFYSNPEKEKDVMEWLFQAENLKKEKEKIKSLGIHAYISTKQPSKQYA